MVDPFDPRKVLNSIGGWGPSGTATTTGGPGTGTPPPPPPGGSTAVTYSTYTAPNGPMGASLPSGTIYTVGSNGSFAVDYRPSTGGGTGVSVSLNPDSTSAWSIRTIGGRDYRVNELTGEVVPLDVPGGVQTGRDPSGYDPSTGLPYGVTRVSTTVSPTGLVYQGIPVNADGSPYTGASASQVPGYSGIKEGPGGLYGLNDKTGQYELIPGSEKLGKATSSGPATYSGGGGYQIPRDYIGEANAKAQGQIAVAQAEAAAQQARDAAQAALQRETLAMQQGFTGEQNALSRAFQAAQQAWQSSVTNRQLQQQDEAQKRAAANDFRSAVSDTDPIAFAGLMKAWGNIENALRGGETAVTDRALGGAAGLLDLIRRPFEPISGFTWNEPTGTFVPNGSGAVGGTTGGAMVPGLTTGGSGGAATPGAAAGGDVGVTTQEFPMSQQERTFQQLQNLHQVGYGRPPTPEELALFNNIAQGRGMDPLVTGNYSGIWQSVDPYAPNWRPPYKGYEIPGFTYNWETNQNEPAGQYGRDIAVDVAPTTPVNTPLVPGTPVPPGTIIPGLARGGMAKGAFVVGEGSRSNPSEHSELVIAPQGAHVVPLDKPQAKRLLNGGLRGYATGTDPFAGMDWWSLQQANEANAPTFQVGVDSQPFIDGSYGTRAQYIAPQPTYTAPTTTTTGGSGTTTVAAPSPSPVPSSGSSVSSTTAPPVVATNTVNTAAVPTTPAPSTTNTTATPAAPAPANTTVGGLVNYGGQQITPDYQARLGEIRNFRTDPTQNTYDRTLNPMDVSFNNLDPISQEVFYRGRQAEFGIPVLAQQWEQNRFRLPGLSRASVGIGY